MVGVGLRKLFRVETSLQMPQICCGSMHILIIKCSILHVVLFLRGLDRVFIRIRQGDLFIIEVNKNLVLLQNSALAYCLSVPNYSLTFVNINELIASAKKLPASFDVVMFCCGLHLMRNGIDA